MTLPCRSMGECTFDVGDGGTKMELSSTGMIGHMQSKHDHATNAIACRSLELLCDCVDEHDGYDLVWSISGVMCRWYCHHSTIPHASTQRLPLGIRLWRLQLARRGREARRRMIGSSGEQRVGYGRSRSRSKRRHVLAVALAVSCHCHLVRPDQLLSVLLPSLHRLSHQRLQLLGTPTRPPHLVGLLRSRLHQVLLCCELAATGRCYRASKAACRKQKPSCRP